MNMAGTPYFDKMNNSYEFKWRIMDLWSELGGGVLFSNSKSILQTREMLELGTASTASGLAKFIDYIKSLGFNALSHYGNPDNCKDAIYNFSGYLKQKNIGHICRRYWNEYRRGYSWPPDFSTVREPVISEKHCPFNPEVKKFWQERIEKDIEMMPGLAGYVIAGSEYYCIQGVPWNCDCEKCQKLTRRERMIAALKLMGDLLKKYNKTFFWEAVLDDPWNMEDEVELFGNLTGLIPDNVYVIIKDTYWDFHPGWPRHSVFYTIKKDASGNSPYITSIALVGEYRGVNSVHWSMAEEWSKTFRDVKGTGQQGIWAMTIENPENYDNLLNLSNWFAVSRYFKDVNTKPDKILLEWAREEFGKDAASAVVKIIKKMTEANRKILEFRGLWTQNHSKFPSLVYLESHLCGPYKEMESIEGMLGLELPLNSYPENIAKEIKEDCNIFPVFNRIPLNEKLKNEMINEKREAIILIEECISLLDSIRNKIDKIKYDKLSDDFNKNKNDAIFWETALELYLDWKLGALTIGKIDKELEKCKGLNGTLLEEPFKRNPKPASIVSLDPASLLTFADELKSELREPKLKEFLKENKGNY